MADPVEDALLNYEDVDDVDESSVTTKKGKVSVKGHYVGVHSTGFRDFLLSPELNHAIGDCGFEHPSQVQQECIPQALLGSDIICQGKSGMGKTAVFVISVLHQLDPVPGEVSCLVLAPTRELAFQIGSEFNRFAKYLPKVKSAVLIGGIPKATHRDVIKNEKPSVIIASPGRCLDLIKDQDLDLSKVRFFVIDEADKVLEQDDMKADIEKIARSLPQDRQTMLFSATMPEAMKEICRKFTRNAVEVFVDDDKKLTLHGLQQFFIRLSPDQKNRKLIEILDNFKFNQLVVFVSEVKRAKALDKLLNDCQYPSIAIYRGMDQQERIKAYHQFKEFQKKLLVSTDVFARGIDVERVNIVVNYDMPSKSDTYLHRVGRAGRFGTKGLAVSFVSTDEDNTMLQQIQERFEVSIPELPASIDAETYMNA
jgi:ATP-dependent RNA helicase UAP56/SUB2